MRVIVPSTSENALLNASLSPAHFKPNLRPWLPIQEISSDQWAVVFVLPVYKLS